MKQAKALTTQFKHVGSGLLELQAADLVVTSGPDRGLRLELGLNSFRIGTSPECEMVLSDNTVSGVHGEVQVTAEGYSIRDLQSKNGIRLGRWLVRAAPLMDGMRLTLGNTVIAVKATGGYRDIELDTAGRLGPLCVQSIKMRALAKALRKLAAAEITVLIEGETGTGKEVVATAVHALSPRAREPLVVADCGAIPDRLFVAELFGYEKGAYTGADASREGLLEQAHGGTLFLDEIGELPLEVQPTLLRAIDRKVSRRVGGRREISHDVRIVAATNRNLQQEVKAGRFREDLFFRLAVGRVRVPPLRERREDIPVLAQELADELGASLSPEAMRLILAYDWPGNVRELRNTIARMAVGSGELDDRELLRPANPRIREIAPLPEARRAANERFERGYLEEVLGAAQGNHTHAAKLAGVSRAMLTRLVARHNMRAKDR